MFGHIPGYPPGSTFESRRELAEAGVHRPLQAGICGRANEGAESIVLSGGYVDDEDRGDVIVYTGAGGRDPATGRQVAHQQLNRHNLALANSLRHGLPVRVIRRTERGGYRYDGLYRVERYWQDVGQDGYRIWRFRLEPWAEEHVAEPRDEWEAAPRREERVQRIVRSTAVAERVKDLHGHRCQVCGIRIETAAGPYAEAAHIRPLGPPHDGPDEMENILCLCPNHHVLFDQHGFAIAEDLSLIGLEGRLRTHPRHPLHPAHLRYHRQHIHGAA